MERNVFRACAIGLMLSVVAGGALADETATSIEPVFSTTTRVECTQVGAQGGGWIGQALGAVVGGGVGSQVGKGSGQAAAAAIGATLGAQAGAAVTNNGQPAGQTCRDVHERTLMGYTARTSMGGSVFLPLSVVRGSALGAN